MKLNKLVLSTIMAITLLGCNSTSNTHKASIESDLRMMTHKLVSTDSSFESSIEELMPKGVKRMAKDELSLTSVITPNGEVNYETYSALTSRSAVKSLLGSPVRDDQQYNVYSYSGSNNSFITFVFNNSSKVERVEGYSNSNNW
ncbi:hypothetical protein [Photobacterium nomapromontoriensis]|uniref:hypothetical protein n=1 Tax=Photobacterium nomapromontoriensis TaxID=2910237 RepID=UPI003D0978C5